jgi:hypothetical protein
VTAPQSEHIDEKLARLERLERENEMLKEALKRMLKPIGATLSYTEKLHDGIARRALGGVA